MKNRRIEFSRCHRRRRRCPSRKRSIEFSNSADVIEDEGDVHVESVVNSCRSDEGLLVVGLIADIAACRLASVFDLQ